MNEIHLHGEIKMTWVYNGNLYARVALRRKRGRPKRLPSAGGRYDYVTVAFLDGAREGMHLQPGQFLTAHGWLQSRDYEESLQTFLMRAGATDQGAEKAQAHDLRVQRSVTEVVAERWQVVTP